jgi:hypothetical protein
LKGSREGISIVIPSGNFEEWYAGHGKSASYESFAWRNSESTDGFKFQYETICTIQTQT